LLAGAIFFSGRRAAHEAAIIVFINTVLKRVVNTNEIAFRPGSSLLSFPRD
jgi:hypothetical protein